MTDTYKIICNLIKTVLHGDTFSTDEGIDWNTVFFEMDNHKVATLVSPVISKLPLDDSLRSRWKKYLISNRVFYEQLLCEQTNALSLLDGIPSAILKGTAASVYYADPYLRTMGDIDILVASEFYDKAWTIFNNNYYEHKIIIEIKHTEFVKGNIEIELHRGMASHFVGNKQEYFDSVLFDAMDRLEKRSIGESSFCMFPKTENGLILLRHMHQHLQEGIGLRHVVDWMMYLMDKDPVDWERFNVVSHEMGIYKLQCVLTRICEMYLGLEHSSDIDWCRPADEDLCERLMDYIISRGNFGRAADTYAYKFAMTDIKGNILKRFQNSGMYNWKAAQEHKILRPFAWLYQAVRVSKKILTRDDAVAALRADIQEAEKIRALMDDLGLERLRAVAK